VKAAQPGPGYRCRRSCLAWQATQRAASGRASSRPSGIWSPQSTHRPYVFSSMRRSAASTSSRWLRAEWRIASVRSASERWDPASAGSCGYPAPAIGAGRSPCRMDIDRSRSSRISSRRLRATVMSTTVLASVRGRYAAQARVSRGRVPRTQNNSPGGRSSWADAAPEPPPAEASGVMSSGPLFRTELTAIDTGCDVRPPAIAGSIVA